MSDCLDEMEKAGAPVNPFDELLPGDIGYVDPRTLVTVTDNVDPRKIDLNVDPRKFEDSDRHLPRLKINVDPRTRAKLQDLASTHGYTVAALIRCCIDGHLPKMETWLKTQSP